MDQCLWGSNTHFAAVACELEPKTHLVTLVNDMCFKINKGNCTIRPLLDLSVSFIPSIMKN